MHPQLVATPFAQMHANYTQSPETSTHWKAYNEHRTVQALELARFVSSTSDGADVVFVAGDLNSWPQSLQMRFDSISENFTYLRVDACCQTESLLFNPNSD